MGNLNAGVLPALPARQGVLESWTTKWRGDKPLLHYSIAPLLLLP